MLRRFLAVLFGTRSEMVQVSPSDRSCFSVWIQSIGPCPVHAISQAQLVVTSVRGQVFTETHTAKGGSPSTCLPLASPG